MYHLSFKVTKYLNRQTIDNRMKLARNIAIEAFAFCLNNTKQEVTKDKKCIDLLLDKIRALINTDKIQKIDVIKKLKYAPSSE